MQRSSPLEGAKWIGAHQACQSPIITRRFFVTEVKVATLFVTGLGYFEACINGKSVTEDRFLPLVTDYEPRDLSKFLYPLHDTLTHRIYFCQFDVTDLLREGENTLTIQLGNGWYRQTEREAEGVTAFGEELKTIFSIHMDTHEGDIVINSDGSETWRGSEIVYNQLFIGEVVDATAPMGTEQKVAILSAPKGQLCPQIGVADRCIRTIHPRRIAMKSDRKIYDVGENISGVVRVHTSASRGSRITMRFAENLTGDGELDFDSTGANYACSSGRPQIMTDIFICDGTRRTFEPKFVWHAFRYFEVVGEVDDLEVLVIHSDCPVTARFDSPSEGLNFLFDAYVRTQLNNMHGSIPSDCPHRERLGYTGDGQICAEAAMMLLDTKEFYRKWIRDILDSQDMVSGHVQHTAPLMGGGGGPGGWGCAIVIVPYRYYRHYGDRTILEQCYEPMRRWVEYLKSRSEKGLIVREEEGGWCLGDWCTTEEPVQIEEAYVNSCFFVKILEMMMEIAHVLGQDEHIPEYRDLRDVVVDAINREYYDPTTGRYQDNVQGADAYALWAGLAGEDTARKMARRYDRLGHFDTGFLGTDILMEMLCQYGHADTALRLLESEELGSFLYMKHGGATTLWETWHHGSSDDHPMFGACVRQLFSALLGIGQADTSVGYQALRIAPQIPDTLPWAEGAVVLPCGEVRVRWEKKEDQILFCIHIPQGVPATFCFSGNESELKSGENEFMIKTIL